jgi:hypothetical protein
MFEKSLRSAIVKLLITSQAACLAADWVMQTQERLASCRHMVLGRQLKYRPDETMSWTPMGSATSASKAAAIKRLKDGMAGYYISILCKCEGVKCCGDVGV